MLIPITHFTITVSKLIITKRMINITTTRSVCVVPISITIFTRFSGFLLPFVGCTWFYISLVLSYVKFGSSNIFFNVRSWTIWSRNNSSKLFQKLHNIDSYWKFLMAITTIHVLHHGRSKTYIRSDKHTILHYRISVSNTTCSL